jgi:7-cyano-7-deazaguanine synthase
MSTPPARPLAVVLLSGGMDSATCLAQARADGFDVVALSFDYGQRHRFELEAAAAVARRLGAREHRVLRVDLASLGGSALTADVAVPKDRSDAEIGAGIPVTYVPARNTVFLALALAAAEAWDADAIYLGVNALDTSGYPDCRPEFVEAFRRVAALGTRRGVEGRPIGIRAPLEDDTKADVVRRALRLGVPLELTLSCYDPREHEGRALPCGRCDACLLRARGFRAAGVDDPARGTRPSP